MMLSSPVVVMYGIKKPAPILISSSVSTRVSVGLHETEVEISA
jgi:hypothetical protein